MDDAVPTPADLRMRTSDFVRALAFAMVIVIVTAVTVASLVDDPPTQPVARVTTEDLAAMADMARAITSDPRSTPAQRRTARRLIEVVDAVENGEVRIIPPTTSAATVPAPSTTSTTTTTTTTTPTTPRRPRIIVDPWPGQVDALPPLPTLPVP